MDNKIESVLKLDKLVFDEIEFKRNGLKNENEIKFNMQAQGSKKRNRGFVSG